MEKLGLFVLVTLGIFFIILLAPLLGGIAGWIVGLIFPGTLDALKEALGLTATNFQLGAILGFVGGFFRSFNAKG